MHHWILVPRESDVANLARLLRLHQCFERSVLREESIRVFQADVLVVLHQVDVIRLKPRERFIDLLRRRLPGASIELGHQERLLPVAIAQRPSHTELALAIVIVPAVV